MKILCCWEESPRRRGNLKRGSSSLSFSIVVTMLVAVVVLLVMLSPVEGAALAEDPQEEPVSGVGMEVDDEEKLVVEMMRRQEQEEHAAAAGVVPHHKALQAAQQLLERYEKRMEMAAAGDDDQVAGGERESSNPDGEAVDRHQHHNHRRPQSLPQGRTAMGRDRTNNRRSIWADDAEKRASELCGTSASLECGKKILSMTEGQEMSDLSVHTKCNFRDEFLACIDTQKRDCLELASKSVLPQLPPKEVIKMEQGRLWKVLWTAGGCVLTD